MGKREGDCAICNAVAVKGGLFKGEKGIPRCKNRTVRYCDWVSNSWSQLNKRRRRIWEKSIKSFMWER